jgi:hypothetical protein
MSMKNSSDTIGNQTHNLLACSTVPHPTAPLHAPVLVAVVVAAAAAAAAAVVVAAAAAVVVVVAAAAVVVVVVLFNSKALGGFSFAYSHCSTI